HDALYSWHRNRVSEDDYSYVTVDRVSRDAFAESFQSRLLETRRSNGCAHGAGKNACGGAEQPPLGANPSRTERGPIAQRQSRGLIIPWFQVRILVGPLGQEGTATKHYSSAS